MDYTVKEFTADEHGAEAIATFCGAIDAVQEHNRRALATLEPHELARFETWLRTRTRTQPPAQPRAPQRPTNGHAPREARNERRRGSRRGERATSSSSDDPGPEPPAARPCACGCGRPRRPEHKYYATDECRKRHARARKRLQRAREREQPERVVERRLKRLDVADLPRRCRCSSEAVDLDPENAWICVGCGRPKTLGRLRVNGHDAHLVEVRGWMRNDRAAVQHPRVAREWRTRPSRRLAAKLRKSKRETRAEVVL
jgi:hypothetical protein